ncbi:CBASS oligonucleotide cyclase [Roseivirga thermotolerans]|uniref:Nucleotidyltransferase n=1 Tax=Roseivirga thermotolerans TaxID=1758176 RepID=A0ABQ3IBA7_9BACT|nr:CBASS oligonucleotide cyclase [Roseivirga thermotolerans]GHE74579.1 nucleotidyltransferase [Roseivirga thermotolerans]
MASSKDTYFYQKQTPDEIRKKIEEAREKLTDPKFDQEINNLIRELLLSINSRDSQALQTHLNEIRKALESEIAGTIDLKYAGSVAKHTYVNGLSDVDTLAILNGSELKNLSPSEVKDYFFHKIQQRFPRTEIKKGNLAITVRFSDGAEIQVLPAVKSQTGVKISSLDGDSWSPIIKPEKFAVSLRAINRSMSGKAIPVIKLAKSIIAQQPEKRRLSGYHIEALAIEVFSKYNGSKNIKSMIKTFFKEGSVRILNPLKDKTGQSTHVDDYLGNANSISRKIVSDAFRVMSKRMESADSNKMSSVWKNLLT